MSEKQYKRKKVPTVLQMEAVECGAASLAMILAYFGKYIPLEELRVACGVSRDGSKASNIVKAGKSFGLEVAGFRKEPQELKNMACPMIVHWNFNHFLVLEGFHKGKVYINDPASGPRAVSEEEFDQSFTGVVLTFGPTKDFQKSGSKPSLVNGLKNRLRGSEKAVGFIILLGLFMVIPGVVIPVFSKIFVDDILLGSKDDWLKPLLWGMALTAILRGLLTWIQEHYLLKLETKISITSSSQFFWHVLRLPVEFFTQRFSGDISSRMQSNERVANLLGGQLAVNTINMITIVFYFILMFRYNITLAIVGCLMAFLNLAYLKYVNDRRVDQNRKLMQSKGKLVANSMAGLQIIETLKATGSESDFFAKWSGYQGKTLNSEQEIGKSSNYLLAVPTFLTTFTNGVILVFGAWYVIEGKMTIGMLVAFQSLLSSFLTPVTGLVNLGSQLQELEGDMNRLDDVLRYPVDKGLENEVIAEEEAKEEQLEKLKGYITIKNLTFGYSPLERPLIEDFNLTLKPGARVALVGGSGSGKSTIARLVTGQYKPWTGEILFDGLPREEIPRVALCGSMSVVDQDIVLFSGTVKDNITIWNPAIPEIDIVRAAKDACIHEEITSRKGGYSHIVQEGGGNFSGGQRQRIEIARALVGNPSILILDEATSALDPLTEKKIDENIRRRGCTCIIVAHRLSTIRDCDEIIVLEKGKIIQRGTHDELMAQDGVYAELINVS